MVVFHHGYIVSLAFGFESGIIHPGNLTSIVKELTAAGRTRFPKLVISILSNEDVTIVTEFKSWQHITNTVVVGVTLSDTK